MALLHDICMDGFSHKEHHHQKSASQPVQVPGIHSRLTESELLEIGTKWIFVHIKVWGNKNEYPEKGQSLTLNN